MIRASDPSDFSDQVQAAQDRFEQLKHQLDQFPDSPTEIARRLSEELAITLEELHVAAEEMQEQQEHLMENRTALEAERQRYQDLFEFAPNGYLVTDTYGHIQEANQAAITLLGLPRDHLIGRLLVLFIPLKERRAFRTQLSQIQTTLQSIQNLECQIQQFNGTCTACELTASPIQGAQGQLSGFRWLLRDVSERNQIAEMETASRIKDEFLAIVSHELRSPLNPILGWSSLLRNGTLDAAKTAYALEVIEKNAKVQAQLIDDLLDLSRILRGKLSLNPVTVNLIAVAQAAMETMQLAADAKQIELNLVIDQAKVEGAHIQLTPYLSTHPPIYVLGDFARLQQAVWNLLSNAIKFTPQGGRIEVRVTTEQTEPADSPAIGKAVAQLTVCDTGRGIAADFLPHVFDYFRQADSTTTRQFGGLGLGLAIVRHIVEMHGGTVGVASEGEGLGSIFTVRLPLLENQGVRLGSTVNAGDTALSHSSLTGLQILVIDDDHDSREFVSFVLEQAGANVATAATAVEGFLTLAQSPPDVLLSDIGMPDMDGYMLMQQIRALPAEQGGQVQSIAITAYAGEINEQQSLAAGFQSHISKPISPAQLIRTIVAIASSRLTSLN